MALVAKAVALAKWAKGFVGSNPTPSAIGRTELFSKKFNRASRSEAYGGVGVETRIRFLRSRLEPKIFKSEDFLGVGSSDTLMYNACPALPVRVLYRFYFLPARDRQTPLH